VKTSEGLCECLENNTYNETLNQCIQCHKACKVCTKPHSDIHCVACNFNHLGWAGSTICKLFCPSGFSANTTVDG
jgi:hypothetical protein